eukprot:6183125-Pleurochrysis_carterae.AAC.1
MCCMADSLKLGYICTHYSDIYSQPIRSFSDTVYAFEDSISNLMMVDAGCGLRVAAASRAHR